MIVSAAEVTPAWLAEKLGVEVRSVEVTSGESNWARHVSIVATLGDGRKKALWLKICQGETFGRSEIDYYLRDYVGLEAAPLVRCYDASFVAGAGYHLLLDDLSRQYRDRKEATPTLEHGLALASALARMHRHHWQSADPVDSEAWTRYFDQVRPGVTAIETATGTSFCHRFEAHAERLVERWRNPTGQTLLHGDVNPTNVLTPNQAEFPVFILDRQPFDWSLTYGVAVYDLAYAIVPWWPNAFWREHQGVLLRHWFDTLRVPDYSWTQALADWDLSVEHCLHVPIEWCREAADVERMRPLWAWQLRNILGPSVST